MDLSRPKRRKDVAAVFEYWRSLHQDEFLTPHSGLREWIEIEKRLTQDGCTLDQLRRAIDGIHADDWEDRARNLELFHVVKSLAAVQRFVRIADGDAGEDSSSRRKTDWREDPDLLKIDTELAAEHGLTLEEYRKQCGDP